MYYYRVKCYVEWMKVSVLGNCYKLPIVLAQNLQEKNQATKRSLIRERGQGMSDNKILGSVSLTRLIFAMWSIY